MRAIHVFSIVLIALTTAVCVYVLNTTADFSPFSGSFGVTAETAVEWGGEGLGAGLAPVGESADHEAGESEGETGTDTETEATAEPTEAVTEEAAATAEATEED